MKRIRSKLLSLMLVLTLSVGVVGIINVDTTYAASKKIHVKKSTVSLVKGKTYQQKLINKKGKTIKATKVKWKSKNKKIATINKKGKITAKKAGTVKMTAKYKGRTYKFTVKVKNPTTTATRIYNYVKEFGYSVNSDYLVPGNRCLESEYYYGSDYTDVYIISIDTNDKSKIYFASYRVKPRPGYYEDTTESTVLTYDMKSKKGTVSFWQTYYTSSSFSSWSHYTTQGVLTYASYKGASYYADETGITGITVGDNHTSVETGSYDSKTLIVSTRDMLAGVDKFLSKEMGYRLRNIGFSKL